MSADAGSVPVQLNLEKLSDQVYRIMLDRIVTGVFRPGARLRLEQLVSELEISKTPLREALSHLQRERLIVTKPRSGTFVAVPDLNDIVDICDLRRAIEWQAVQAATPAISAELLAELMTEVIQAEHLAQEGDYGPFFASDARLHQTIFDHCNNRRLRDVRDTIDSYVRWLRVLGATGPHRIGGSSLRHRQIIDAMARRDIAAAQETMALHIEEVKQWMVEDYAAAVAPPSDSHE